MEIVPPENGGAPLSSEIIVVKIPCGAGFEAGDDGPLMVPRSKVSDRVVGSPPPQSTEVDERDITSSRIAPQLGVPPKVHPEGAWKVMEPTP